jgi:hypothetical protein
MMDGELAIYACRYGRVRGRDNSDFGWAETQLMTSTIWASLNCVRDTTLVRNSLAYPTTISPTSRAGQLHSVHRYRNRSVVQRCLPYQPSTMCSTSMLKNLSRKCGKNTVRRKHAMNLISKECRDFYDVTEIVSSRSNLCDRRCSPETRSFSTRLR